MLRLVPASTHDAPTQRPLAVSIAVVAYQAHPLCATNSNGQNLSFYQSSGVRLGLECVAEDPAVWINAVVEDTVLLGPRS